MRAGDDHIRIEPRDSMRRRVYIAPLGLWLTLDAGKLDRIEVITDTGSVRAGLSAANPFTPEALLRMEQPANLPGVGTYRPAQELAHGRGGYRVELGHRTTWVELNSNER